MVAGNNGEYQLHGNAVPLPFSHGSGNHARAEAAAPGGHQGRGLPTDPLYRLGRTAGAEERAGNSDRCRRRDT